MAKVLFGVTQIKKPTPASINRAVRVFTVAAAIFLAWMSTTNLLGPHSKDIINQVLGLALGLTNGLAPLFGVQLTGSVPAEAVTAVETKPDVK